MKTELTEIEIHFLESLLRKLQGHLESRYCIMPGHIQDGFYIALYDCDGERYVEVGAPTIKELITEAIDKKNYATKI